MIEWAALLLVWFALAMLVVRRYALKIQRNPAMDALGAAMPPGFLIGLSQGAVSLIGSALINRDMGLWLMSVFTAVASGPFWGFVLFRHGLAIRRRARAQVDSGPA